MNSTWQVQDAKNRFSELIEDTINKGPQIVTRHGKPVVKVVPFETTPKRAGSRGKKHTGASLFELLSQCPVKFELLVARDRKDYGRDIDFS